MTDECIRLLVENGHFMGYEWSHKKKIHKKVQMAKMIADRCLCHENDSASFLSLPR